MAIEEAMETVPVVTPKALISGPPALSDIFSASEDEQEEEGRDEELLENSEGFFAKRQAPPTNPFVPAGFAPSEWACMHAEEPTSIPNKYTPTPPETKLLSVSPTAVPDLHLDDHKTTGQIDENESIASVSTIGRIFEDLSSLPSLMADNFPGRKNGENSTLVSASNLSSTSSANQDVVPPISVHSQIWDDNSTIGSVNSVPTDKLDEVIAEKLRQVDVDETIGDTQRSAVALMRSSSSASARSLKRKKAVSPTDIKCDQSALSGQVSYATGVASPRSVSNRTALVRELKSAIEEYGRFHVRCASIACALADMHDYGHEYPQALKLYREATTIYTTKLGDHHETTIDAKVQLGKILEKMGDHDRAIELYFSVLSMQKAIFGDTHESIPNTLSHLASALKRKGRPAQSIKELKRALKLYRGSLGDSHPRVAEIVDEISALYVIVGDYDKATAILEEVVKLKAATVGMNHEEVAKTLFDLATAYEAAGETTKALRTLKRCFSIHSNIHGDNSDKATMVLERIAQVCRNTGDTERAVAAFLGVLRARKDLHGDSHPIVADTYLQLGIALRENKQQDKAMKCMKQALSIYVGEGKDMHDVGMIAEVMQEMAFIHRSKGQLNDAIKIFKQVLTIRQKMGEQELHRVADTLFHLGTTELELKNHSKALNYFMEALNIYEKTSNEIGVDFAKTLYCTGIVFDASRHQERAQEAYDEAIKVFKSQGLSDRQVKDIVALLNKLKTSESTSKRGNRTRK
ncbi:hypothetical protein MHU86_534 [Fragilaria crotonensis]|nr:hypothetical protein MHU86_534 [Fragilaria crotonensis]